MNLSHKTTSIQKHRQPGTAENQTASQTHANPAKIRQNHPEIPQNQDPTASKTEASHSITEKPESLPQEPYARQPVRQKQTKPPAYPFNRYIMSKSGENNRRRWMPSSLPPRSSRGPTSPPVRRDIRRLRRPVNTPISPKRHFRRDPRSPRSSSFTMRRARAKAAVSAKAKPFQPPVTCRRSR